MKNILFIFIIVFIFSCGNEKELQLPQIKKASITELQDVSAAYLFYVETQPDSVLLNRKNLISTTNWLVNVDKRLTLKQAIPHIKLLQDKKTSSSHKNEKAKNYFTCHDLSRNNLGFLEFTDVNFHEEHSGSYFAKISQLDFTKKLYINVISPERVDLILPSKEIDFHTSNISDFKNVITKELKKEKELVKVIIDLKKEISFQDYILIKSELLSLTLENIEISKNEFIY